MFIISLFIYIQSANSKTVDIEMKNYKFQIKYEKEFIYYLDSNTDLKIDKKICNEHLVNNTYRVLENFLSTPANSTKGQNSYLIKINGVSGFDSMENKRAKFFFDFSNFMTKLKIEEGLNCKN